MEKTKTIVYWIATAAMCFGMLWSSIIQLLKTKAMIDLMKHLGYPPYLLSILGVWKVLGVITIVVPGFKLLKEWAYAGFFFLMTGALVSHLMMGDTGKAIAGPLMQTIFIILSWYFRPASRKIASVK